jgi:hypothetical protein
MFSQISNLFIFTGEQKGFSWDVEDHDQRRRAFKLLRGNPGAAP